MKRARYKGDAGFQRYVGWCVIGTRRRLAQTAGNPQFDGWQGRWSAEKEHLAANQNKTLRERGPPWGRHGGQWPERGRENVMFFTDSAGVSLTNWFNNQGQLYVLRAKLTS